MARVEIEGIGVVEVDDSFRDLSEADQQKTLSEIRDARLNKPSSFSQLVGAPIRGFNVGALADTLGAPVDLTNFLIKSVDKASEMIGGPFIDEDFFVPSEKPFLGSEFLKDALVATGSGYRDEADLPVDQRALSRGGRTAGQVMTSTLPLFGAARRMSPAQAMMKAPPGKSVVKQQLSEIVKSTARNPAKMATIEGTSALGAGTLRAGAEAIDPGNEFLGMGAELLGGFAGPVPAARTAFNKAKGVAEGFTPKGREQAASRKVREILEQNQFLI